MITVAQLLALINGHPIADIEAWLDAFEAAHPDAAAAVSAVRAIVQAVAGALPQAGTLGIADVVQQLRDGFGQSNSDTGMTI